MDHAAVSERCETLFGIPFRTVSLLVLFLVMLDSWLTDRSLSTRQGEELNPFMDWVYHHGGPLTFVAFKLVLTGLCLLWMHHRAPRSHARVAALVALAIYVPVAGFHIAALYR